MAHVNYTLPACMKSHLPTEVGLTTYTSKIRPILEYASPVWGGLPGYWQNEVEKVQRRSLRILRLDSDFLPTQETRRKKQLVASLKGYVKIQNLLAISFCQTR